MDAEETQFEGEVISIVVIVTNFLSILHKAEAAHGLDDGAKLQKYRFLSNYFQHMSPDLTQQLTSLLACVQELNAYVADLLRLGAAVDSWPVRGEDYQCAEEGVGRIRRCQQTWQFILKQLTTLGTKYFPDDRKAKIETRTTLVATVDKLSRLLKARAERGLAMGRMITAQGDRNAEDLARCCVAVDQLRTHPDVSDLYDAQVTRCREVMRALELYRQLREEFATSTGSLEDEDSITNQMAWATTKLRQSGALRVLGDPVNGEQPLLEAFLEPAQLALDRIEIKGRSLEILESALQSGDSQKLTDVVALAEAMGFGKATTGRVTETVHEEWQRLVRCKELLAKLNTIQSLVEEMMAARRKATSHACTEAIRHVNLFLQSQSLVTGEGAKGELAVPHRTDGHWLPAHSDLYRELCAAQSRHLQKQNLRKTASLNQERVPRMVSLSRAASMDVTMSESPRTAEGAREGVRVKLHHGDDIRVLTVGPRWSFAELYMRVADLLLPADERFREPLRVRYPDEAGDLITIDTDGELQEFWKHAAGATGRLALHVDQRPAPARRSSSVSKLRAASSPTRRRRMGRSPSPAAALAVVTAAVANRRSGQRPQRPDSVHGDLYRVSDSNESAVSWGPVTPQPIGSQVSEKGAAALPLSASRRSVASDPAPPSYDVACAPPGTATVFRDHPYVTLGSGVIDASPSTPPMPPRLSRRATPIVPDDPPWSGPETPSFPNSASNRRMTQSFTSSNSPSQYF